MLKWTIYIYILVFSNSALSELYSQSVALLIDDISNNRERIEDFQNSLIQNSSTVINNNFSASISSSQTSQISDELGSMTSTFSLSDPDNITNGVYLSSELATTFKETIIVSDNMASSGQTYSLPLELHLELSGNETLQPSEVLKETFSLLKYVNLTTGANNGNGNVKNFSSRTLNLEDSFTQVMNGVSGDAFNTISIELKLGHNVKMLDQSSYQNIAVANLSGKANFKLVLPPGVNCVSSSGLFPGCFTTPPYCSSNTDTDGDGLLDEWEISGIDTDCDGSPELVLYDLNGNGTIENEEQADPDIKDIYIEIDWMQGFEPDTSVLEKIKEAYRNAPVDCDINEENCKGIRLHLIKDAAIPNTSSLDGIYFSPSNRRNNTNPNLADFYDLRDNNFGRSNESAQKIQAKALAFRYFIFGNNVYTNTGNFVGNAEKPGVNGIVALDSNHSKKTFQAAVLMHELGHTLGLDHGGLVGDPECKPNYVSIMNYAYQVTYPVKSRKLDYSKSTLSRIDENSLNEALGLPLLASNTDIVFGNGAHQVAAGNGAIDWNMNGDPSGTSVTADVNNLSDILSNCDGTGSELQGFDDWDNLVYDFKNTPSYIADSSTLPAGSLFDVDETGFNELLNASPDSDADGELDIFDNCPDTSNTQQEDFDDDLVGDSCDPDIDGDFIPNDWETANSLNPNDPTDALLDFDNDGTTNLEEFYDGTNPNVADNEATTMNAPISFFALALLAVAISIIGVRSARIN